MRSQLVLLHGLGALAALASAATIGLAPRDTDLCIDCSTPVIGNVGWPNGVLADGNYYTPTNTGNWHLGQSTNGVGELELRYNNAESYYYIYNICPSTHNGYCRGYMNQVITVQANVPYEFTIKYAMSNVRGQVDTLEMYVETLPNRRRLAGQSTFAGNTAPGTWAKFTTAPFALDTAGDVLITLTWRNDPNNAVVLFKSISQTAVECKDPNFTPVCPVPSSSVALPSL